MSKSNKLLDDPLVTRKPRSDWQLVQELSLPRGLRRRFQEVIGVSKAGLSRFLKDSREEVPGRLRFLNLDQLVKISTFLQQHRMQVEYELLYEEVRIRYPSLFGYLLGGQVYSLHDEISFDEMWVFTSCPREIEDEMFRWQKMKARYENEDQRLVFFVPSVTVGHSLLRSVRQTTSQAKGVSIVASLAVLLTPRSVVYFDRSNPTLGNSATGLLATVDDSFIPARTGFANNVVTTLFSADLLDKTNQFRWTGRPRRVSVPNEEIFFDLVWEA